MAIPGFPELPQLPELPELPGANLPDFPVIAIKQIDVVS